MPSLGDRFDLDLPVGPQHRNHEHPNSIIFAPIRSMEATDSIHFEKEMQNADFS